MRNTRKAAPADATKRSLPFNVPPQIDRAVKTAAEKVDAVTSEAKKVAAKVEERVRTAATTVKKTGESIAKNPKGMLNDVVRDARTEVEKVRGTLSRDAKALADEVTHRVSGTLEGVVENTLKQLNVVTQKDFKSLAQKVDALGKKIDGLNGGAAAAAPAPRKPRPRKGSTTTAS